MSDKKPPFKVVPAELAKLKIVPNERTPEKLYVCSAKINKKAGLALRKYFDNGNSLPKDIVTLYKKHLIYTYRLSEKGLYYEAGPAADFSEILYIYATDSLDTSSKLMHSDPFYEKEIFYNDSYFEWHIHVPLWKSSLPPMPEQKIEIKIDMITPQKLFVAFGKFNIAPMKDWELGKANRPVYQLFHLANADGIGGVGSMGYSWAGGPSADLSIVLNIYAALNLQMAQFFNESDALVRWGIMSDFRYFDWCIHMPLRKVSPGHKIALITLLKSAGIKVPKIQFHY
ncbi:MAG: hypothetical protein JW967_03845 [Dehalococcoidales bacterium]|nr:hypothetical protein [Dehalococcoidales bacterium]